MTKRKKHIGWGLFFAIVIVGISTHARSDDTSSYGPEAKRFGAGLYLGEPTGLTLKGYITEKFSIDGIAAWGFFDKAFTAIGDITYDFLDIPIDSLVVTLPFYAGAGAKLALNAGPNDNTAVGIRVPVGVAVQWINYPIEAFVEIAPGIEVAPSTDFDLTGGIGVRFYF